VNNPTKEPVICIIGLGYIGLPLVSAFGKELKVIGYDTNLDRISELQQSDMAKNGDIHFTSHPTALKQADFNIICVPTPVTEYKEPDLSAVLDAAITVGQNLKKGAVVILESTVYPGVTEDILVPAIEESGLKCGKNFKVAYSPERTNPGDSKHSLERVTKIVAGMDDETTEMVSSLYRKVVPNVYIARNIKTAEAAKVIENTQRDLNIALMNELAMLFSEIGIDTKDVIEAAATKWNFNKYSPGLVGGHCIPVDPYYLVHKAKEVGFRTQVISAGRSINDNMPKYVAAITLKAINSSSKESGRAKILVMGLTYKENVSDIRESPALGIINELKKNRVEVYGYDPYLTEANIGRGFDIKFIDFFNQVEDVKFDGIIFTVAHNAFRKLELTNLTRMQNPNPVLVDVRRVFDGEEARKAGFTYITL
jgi:UDPglucose 6-dehydrogenase/UDP-N-acetyl-D-galactosamine dehydrogenase